MTPHAMIRPEWSPITILLMVMGFVVFWPLGLAMLAYILFGNKFEVFKRSPADAAETMRSGFCGARRRWDNKFSNGNVAFEDWRRSELQRLDEQRRKLDEMRTEFDAYALELRRARDQEEFDRFMRERNRNDDGSTDGTASF